MQFYDKVAGSHSSSPSEASATAWIVQAEDVAQRRKSAPDLPFTAAEAVAIARNARRKSLRVPATQPMTPDRTHVTGKAAMPSSLPHTGQDYIKVYALFAY